MRLRTTLLHVAVLLTAGCGGTVQGASAKDGGGIDATKDGSPLEPEAACGGCNCPEPTSGNITSDQACALAPTLTTPFGSACDTLCGALNDGSSYAYFCALPADYMSAYQASVDAGSGSGDAGRDAGASCPAWTGTVTLQCSIECMGRRTCGIADPPRGADASLGDVLAGRAYLEEVSVHAFARLERELAAHGAPPSLLRDARRARRDEVRHTAMMSRLARRFGGRPRSPQPLAPVEVRSLRDIALENAVEGCVRETYGAVVGLVEARRSSDRDVRGAMEQIGADECRHAELAWEVARWILPRLTAAEREEIRRSMRSAIDALSADGDAAVVSALERAVWRRTDDVSTV
jgi:hypothetical protein